MELASQGKNSKFNRKFWPPPGSTFHFIEAYKLYLDWDNRVCKHIVNEALSTNIEEIAQILEKLGQSKDNWWCKSSFSKERLSRHGYLIRIDCRINLNYHFTTITFRKRREGSAVQCLFHARLARNPHPPKRPAE